MEKFRRFIADNPSYHLFAIAKSWLGPVVDDSLVSLDGFSIIRQDRNINGGELALYVRNGYKVTKLASSNTLGLGRPLIPEYLFCAVQQGESPPHLSRYNLQASQDSYAKRSRAV